MAVLEEENFHFCVKERAIGEWPNFVLEIRHDQQTDDDKHRLGWQLPNRDCGVS